MGKMKLIRRLAASAAAGLLIAAGVTMTAFASGAEEASFVTSGIGVKDGGVDITLGKNTIRFEDGHVGKYVDGVAPSCTEDGFTEGVYCLFCKKIVRGQEVIPALGHNDADENGICDVCGETLLENEPVEPDEPIVEDPSVVEPPAEPEKETEAAPVEDPDKEKEPEEDSESHFIKDETIQNNEGKEASEDAVFAVLDGADATWDPNSEEDYVVRSEADFSTFVDFTLDGVTVDPQYYTVSEGSTIVRVKADYMRTIPAGEHTVAIVSTNGCAETKLTVLEAMRQEDSAESEKKQEEEKKPETLAAPKEENTEKAPGTGDRGMTTALWMLCFFGCMIFVSGCYGFRKQK